MVIGTQLLIYSLAAGVCGQRALEQLQGGFDSTLKLLLALLGGAALSQMVGTPQSDAKSQTQGM